MPTPVITVAQMREWEQASWKAGLNETEVIARVGQLVARRALQLTRPGSVILILAGKGHNGDDARAARENLHNRRVHLINVDDPSGALGDLKRLLGRRPALVIDGLFGIGLNRPLSDAWIEFISALNAARLLVLSIDVPSGLNADSGKPEGAAVQASVTMTLGAPKSGLLPTAAAQFVSHLEVVPDIGLIACPHAGDLNWTLPGDFIGFPPFRPAIGHKGDFGRLGIVAGSLGFHGAGILAARGAQRAQPGLITLYTQENIYHVTASQLQAVMVSVWQPQQKLAATHSAMLLGPGLAGETLTDEIKLATRHIWRDAPGPVVVDASAIDWLPLAPLPRNVIRVITPHPGEAARLLRSSTEQVQGDRVQALREISRRLGNCWVVLKGHQTLIGRSTGVIRVNSSGNPYLAQGGSGDVLAGYLSGLLAQPALQNDPLQTICYAVWSHGAAADRLASERKNWVVEDLVAEIGGDVNLPADA